MKLKDADLFRQAALIDGEWIARADMPVIDPATGEPMGHMPDCTAEETTRAIVAAETAMKSWKAKSHLERADKLMAWYDLMLEHADDLAMILTTEQGKPLAEAKGEMRPFRTAGLCRPEQWRRRTDEARNVARNGLPGNDPIGKSSGNLCGACVGLVHVL